MLWTKVTSALEGLDVKERCCVCFSIWSVGYPSVSAPWFAHQCAHLSSKTNIDADEKLHVCEDHLFESFENFMCLNKSIFHELDFL